MKTLEQAWDWYKATKTLLRLVRRLGDRHWDDLPWEGALGKDQQLDFEGKELVKLGDYGLQHLDDLAVLVLFSVFESLVRSRPKADLDQECSKLQHVSLKRAATEMLEGISEGSFFRVLEPFKLADGDLVEQVNQVRRYRNWVAHGRKDDAPASVDPETAYDRLKQFLDVIADNSPSMTSKVELL